MDFQGQGQAITDETEALAIMDSFTKTVFVLPLQDRTAPTFVPTLLDAIWFTRGASDSIHTDAAPELLSALLLPLFSKGTGERYVKTGGQRKQQHTLQFRRGFHCARLSSPGARGEEEKKATRSLTDAWCHIG